MDLIFYALFFTAGVITCAAVPKVYAWGVKVFAKGKAKVDEFND